ncbi:MAG: hypothetical protein OXH73_13505 [Caldilineaceae bacterium]|nr:hypothetical protein [Caldilineaceae bacterium]
MRPRRSRPWRGCTVGTGGEGEWHILTYYYTRICTRGVLHGGSTTGCCSREWQGRRTSFFVRGEHLRSWENVGTVNRYTKEIPAAGAAARVRTSLARMEAGNLSNVRGVGSGVSECRINVGPGYRVYFGRDGDTLIILLGGGTKARQQRDIEGARELWQEYRRRKQQEE